MDNRTVGASALKMSAITLGTRAFATEVSEEEAVRLIHRCLDLGITSFDVVDESQPADNTGGKQRGRTEAILGRALRGRREDSLIATRGGGTLSPEPNLPRHSRATLREQVEESLKRLQTDHLDLFLLHYPDPLTPLAESLEVLASLIDQG
ncbi:MAG: aldo/keto reductase, partial [Armatimonadetes bacterium]|nr:aldo/keto reductase [Armatimonadota bacterium]